MRIIQLEANHDTATSRVHESRKVALGGLVTSSNEHYRLIGQLATREMLNAWVSTFWPAAGMQLLTALGHGDSESFGGHLNVDVLATRYSNSSVRGAVIHLYSCDTALRLGPHLVAQNAARAFIGYNRLVAVGRDSPRSDLFVREAAAIDLAIARGAGSAEIKSAADQAYQTALRELQALPDTEPRDVAALEWNHESLRAPWNQTDLGQL